MPSELPLVKGEGLCEVIKLYHSFVVEKESTSGHFTASLEGVNVAVEFEGNLAMQMPKKGQAHFLMSIGGLKEHVRNNIEIAVTKGDDEEEVFSGEKLETLITRKASEGTIFGNQYGWPDPYPNFRESYWRQIENLAEIWHLPENTVIILTQLVGGLNGIRLYEPDCFLISGQYAVTRLDGRIGIPVNGEMVDKNSVTTEGKIELLRWQQPFDYWVSFYTNMKPPLKVTADYARLSGDLSYEQIGRGVKRRGPESVELSDAEITILEKPASMQSEASAAALGKRAGTVMPVAYQGTLYVHPRILTLAKEQQP